MEINPAVHEVDPDLENLANLVAVGRDQTVLHQINRGSLKDHIQVIHVIPVNLRLPQRDLEDHDQEV